MADDFQITGGTGLVIAADDVNPAGAPRYVQLMKLLSAQPDSVQALDKISGQIAALGADVGFPMFGVVNDHVAGFGVADGHYTPPIYVPNGGQQVYPNGARKIMRDEFSGVNGAAPDATKWSVARQAGAATATLNGSSQLLLNTGGVTSGDGVEVLSVDTYQAPCRLIVAVTVISQRIANQEFSIELVEENTGADAAGTDSAKLLFNGAVNTTSQVTSYSQGDQNPAVNLTTAATSGALKFEIDLMTDEVWFYSASLDSSSARSGNVGHLDRKSPDPTKRYRVRLRLKNTGVAASGTTVQIDSVVIEDNSYLPVELAHARGSLHGGEALPVTLSASGLGLNTTAGGFGAIAIWTDDTSTVLGAAASFSGTFRDMGGTTTGSTMTTKPGLLRMVSIADVVGTLYSECSPDNGTTVYRIGGQLMTQFDGTSRFVATIQQPVVMRYHRPVIVNGATLQTVHRTNTVQLSLPGT